MGIMRRHRPLHAQSPADFRTGPGFEEASRAIPVAVPMVVAVAAIGESVETRP